MYHLLAILTIIVWGTTFVSTKVLLANGLTPADIFLLRFSIAYIGMVATCHKQFFCKSWRDELMMMVAGIAGGSIYFLTENTALMYTQAGNVSLIICLAPLLTAILATTQKTDEKTTFRLWLGSIMALIGVAFVVNDHSGSNSNPLLGNMLALSSAGSWSIYQVIIKPLGKRYGTGMLTRKVFGYGLLTILPFWIYSAPEGIFANIHQIIERPVVFGNILYLGFFASLGCYWMWNKIVEHLGSVVSANYIYFDPIITCIASYIILDEQITPAMTIGGLGILLGVYLAVGLPKPKRIRH